MKKSIVAVTGLLLIYLFVVDRRINYSLQTTRQLVIVAASFVGFLFFLTMPPLEARIMLELKKDRPLTIGVVVVLAVVVTVAIAAFNGKVAAGFIGAASVLLYNILSTPPEP